MSTNRQALDIPGLLDKRSYRVYRLRTDQKKTFREIGVALDLSHNRVHQRQGRARVSARVSQR